MGSEGGRSFVSLELPLAVEDSEAAREKALEMVGGPEALGRAVRQQQVARVGSLVSLGAE